jgi:cupin fold WbuC family metalloprotein
MKSLRKLADGVFFSDEPIVLAGAVEREFLKRKAAETPRRRARICAHNGDGDLLHEMLIAILAGSYVHPHKHVGKTESFHVIEGIADVVIFDDAGGIRSIIRLGDVMSNGIFFYRLPEGIYHTVIIRTDCFMVHEVTVGPFESGATIKADFAPSECHIDDVRSYIRDLEQRIATYHARV